MSLTLTQRINGATWGSHDNWGDKLPLPIEGEPYTIVLEEDEEFKQHPQAHPSHCHVSGIRTLPVTRVICADPHRVVFDAGLIGHRFVFQLTEGMASHERNADRALDRLEQMQTTPELKPSTETRTCWHCQRDFTVARVTQTHCPDCTSVRSMPPRRSDRL